MPEPSVDIVICTRNNRPIIGPTLDAVAAQTGVRVQCYVVDDISSDGTPEFVREQYGWARVIVKSDHTGPAASRNIGISLGQSAYVVFLDSDARPAADWAYRQVRYLEEHPSVGMVCGKLLIAASPDMLDSAYGTMNRYGVAWNQGAGEPASWYSEEADCLYACSAAAMCRRELLESIGGFDEALFAYHEDTDLGWRANLCGYGVRFNPEAVVHHDLHGTMNERTMGDRITYLLWRNRLRSALVNYGLLSVGRYVSVYLILALAHAAAIAPRLPKLRALLWNFAHLRDTLRLRETIQRRRLVPDGDLWRLFQPGLRKPSRESAAPASARRT